MYIIVNIICVLKFFFTDAAARHMPIYNIFTYFMLERKKLDVTFVDHGNRLYFNNYIFCITIIRVLFKINIEAM